MRRRSLLASGVALLGSGLAGCLGQSGDDTATESPTRSETPTTSDTEPVTDADVSLSASVERLQPGAVVLGVDSISTVGDGSQYLYYRVDVTDGDPPDRLDFGFRYGGDIYSPGIDTGGQLWRESRTDDRYTAERGEGWLVFELPATRAARHAALTVGSTEWPVGESVRERLGAPAPSLSLDWNVDAEQTPGETPMSFAVTNDGDRDTRFVAALNAENIDAAYAPIEAFSRRIPGGETVSWEFVHENGVAPGSNAVSDGEVDGRYTLDWTGGRREQAVRFVAEPSSE
ncbi:hypothetical protein [Halobacterium litoreum]|uniref:Uncharacterized protein n=1 Tax=Halobacterium litoreum TaxID=2039234 RepID=A0ABD5NDL1_9EURY|nr:hypothetical protein [Halobacterium litoreum]UHH14110.1 hypothetical protein LT972_03695 [Halobacterium litoreum]